MEPFTDGRRLNTVRFFVRAVGGATLTLLSACGAAHQPAGSVAGPTGVHAAHSQLPAGWRWESYGGVQVGVPNAWSWDNGSQRVSQWCIGNADGVHRHAAVGRPGPATAVGCAVGPSQIDPSTLIAENGVFVAFQLAPARVKSGVVHEGDRATVTIGRAQILVQAEPALRRRIIATIEPVEVDAYGCPAQHPISSHPWIQPSPAVAVGSLREIRDISVCKYTLDYSGATPDVPGRTALLSSARLSGRAARSALRAVASAPPGGGPNEPDSCSTDYSYGDDVIVLRIRSAGGLSEVYLRYSGCNHNGFDDGVGMHQVARSDVSPFVRGANRVFAFSGPASKGLR